MHSLLCYANDKGLTVNVSKRAVLVTGKDWGAQYNMVMTPCLTSRSSVT
jgi:hypothetical protein